MSPGLSKKDLSNISKRFKKERSERVVKDSVYLKEQASLFRKELNKSLKEKNMIKFEHYLKKIISIENISTKKQFSLLLELENTFVNYMVEIFPGNKEVDATIIYLNNHFLHNLLDLHIRKKVSYESLNKKCLDFFKSLKNISTKKGLKFMLEYEINLIKNL